MLCPNPSPMTLDGTNTWVLAEPGSDEVVVVDPGPLDEAHLEAVVEHVRASGRRIALTLLTHGHLDHAESAERFHELTGAPVRGFGRGHDDVREGETITVGGLEILAVPTPGHTSDSFSFVLPADNTLLTGDTVLGRGTSVVAWPDGNLEAYLESLSRIESLTGAGAVTSLLPGHGPTVDDAAATVTFYLQHRAERLEQVRDRGRPRCADGIRRRRDGLCRRAAQRLAGGRAVGAGPARVPAHPPLTLLRDAGRARGTAGSTPCGSRDCAV